MSDVEDDILQNSGGLNEEHEEEEEEAEEQGHSRKDSRKEYDDDEEEEEEEEGDDEDDEDAGVERGRKRPKASSRLYLNCCVIFNLGISSTGTSEMQSTVSWMWRLKLTKRKKRTKMRRNMAEVCKF